MFIRLFLLSRSQLLDLANVRNETLLSERYLEAPTSRGFVLQHGQSEYEGTENMNAQLFAHYPYNFVLCLGKYEGLPVYALTHQTLVNRTAETSPMPSRSPSFSGVAPSLGA